MGDGKKGNGKRGSGKGFDVGLPLYPFPFSHSPIAFSHRARVFDLVAFVESAIG